jgi:hypothetical protein
MEDIIQGNFEHLIKLIESEDPIVRNAAALKLKDLKDDRAIVPLLNSIFKNRNFNGTMVYALESLNCEKHFINIFKILFHEGYEAKIAANSILNEQVFEFTQEDLFCIQSMWKDCILNPKEYEGFGNKETRSMMEDNYDGFMKYLEK